jgi:cytochrome c biogenesis protein CcmG, thiol:disulfide interchange protein DsbE
VRALLLICILLVNIAVSKPDTKLPEFSLPQLSGETLRSQDLNTNIVVLDFWATWCQSCISEIPAYNKLQANYASRGVRVVGIAVQSGWASDVKKFTDEHTMSYAVAVGNDETVSEFEVISFPSTYVIAPGWKTYKKYSGTSESKLAEIERDIETLLGTLKTGVVEQ